MSCERKFVDLAIDDVDAEGQFSGYASLFGEVDMARDVVERGAFAKALEARGARGIRMLFQHDPNQPIGHWISIAEDRRGLFVRGRLSPGVAKAREVLELMRAGALDGLSIGFRTVKARTDGASGVRRIIEADLWEISVVTFPMLARARVETVKSGAIRLAERMRAAATLMRKKEGRTDMKTESTMAPETKSAPPELNAAFDEFMSSFSSFREANDERLARLERRMSADVVTEEKVDRISSALDEQKRTIDELVLKRARPARSGEGRALAGLEHKQAFEAYVRSGDDRLLRSFEAKAMSYGSGQDGGYLVPDEVETEIGTRLAALSPIRAIASVRQVSGAILKKPFQVTGPAVGWVGETAARPQTDTSVLDELQFPTMELYAMPAATATLLEDAAVDLDQWITGEVEAAFAEQEGAAFVNGDGTNKPTGFLDYDQVGEAAWEWGKLGYIATGVEGALPASGASDVLIDTVYALKAGYRQNASWVMNRRTQAAIRKLKDEDGNYLWQPPAIPGSRAMLMGFPLVEAEDMPDIDDDVTPIAFGDFRRGYLVVDRAGVRVLRDPYSAKPYVLFYTTKRVGGGVQDFDAIKLLKFGTA